MRLQTITLAAALIIASCAESARENVFDPVNRITVEMSVPEFVGGTVRVEWRYIAEGDGVESFRIVRESGGIATDVATVAATVSLTSDWVTQSFSDSTLVSGARVIYHVVGMGVGGLEATSNSASILIEGTRLTSAESDSKVLAIGLTWGDPPEGATGFRVLRSQDGEAPTVIFTTDDASLRTYDDRDLEGNTTYTYTVVTLLGDVEISSASLLANIFAETPARRTTWFWAPDRRDNPIDNATQLLATGPALSGAAIRFLMVTDQEVYGISFTGTAQVNGGGGAQVLTAGEFDATSVSVGYFAADPVFQTLVGGVDPAGGRTFLNTYVNWSPDRSAEWPSEGATRTGLAVMAEHILFYSGTTLRLLSDTLTVVSEATISAEEPIDIDYVGEEIWLAYPDRMMKSYPVSDLTELSAWETIPVPADITVRSITGCGERVALFDGVAGKIHLLDPSGELVLSWDAQGPSLAKGDLVCSPTDNEQIMIQSDGAGWYYVYDSAGFLP